MIRLLMVVVMLFLMSSCAQIARNDEGVTTIQMIHTEGQGVFSLFTGRTSSCSFITNEDGAVVDEMKFDAAENKCSATIVRNKPGDPGDIEGGPDEGTDE